MDEITVPIYLLTGFLESGKTSFLDFTLQQDYFYIEGKTLLILCEEGEVEYSRDMLAMSNTVVEVIEKEEDLTTDRLVAMDILHQPERVIIEYNGMWLVSNFHKLQKPKGWGVEQQITCVDASTFQLYMANMKSIFMDMVRTSDMVVFNRCRREDPLASYRRSIKVANQRAEVIFEDEEGEIGDIFQDEMPFDVNAPVIEIEDRDYALFYRDIAEKLDEYIGKTVRFKGMAAVNKKVPAGYIVLGRYIMTCCEADIAYDGFAVRCGRLAEGVKTRDWLYVTGKVMYEYNSVYRSKGPVIIAEKLEPAEKAEQEVATFY